MQDDGEPAGGALALMVYGALGLPVPYGEGSAAASLVPGHFEPAGVEKIARRAVQEVRKTGRNVPTFEEFARIAAGKPAGIVPEFDPGTSKPGGREYLRRALEYRNACDLFRKKRELEKAICERFKRSAGERPAIFADYLAHLAAHHSESLAPFFRPWRLPIPERDRERHTIISGKSGYGKTTLLKVLVYGYVRSPGRGVVLLDPHGDLAEEVARLKEHDGSGRLVYFDPFLSDGLSPVINPFDLRDRSPESVDLATNELVAVFRAVMSTSGTTFSAQMEQVLKPCIAALMIRQGSTLRDLRDFMDDEKNPPLLAYATKALRNPEQVDFLRSDFLRDAYGPTKQAIRTKLMLMMNSYAFVRCVVGPSTIDLESEMDRGAVVVFNLANGKLGDDTTETMGRFFVGMVQAIAQRRAGREKEHRRPVHLFMDECELFISPTIQKILKESRKFGLHLTLAQQVLGHRMTQELKETILGNTAVKITGANALRTLRTVSEETGADLDELQRLKPGEFHLKSGEAPSVKMKVSRFLEEPGRYVTPEGWEVEKARQIAAYYRQDGQAAGRGSGKTPERPAGSPPIIDL